MLDSQSLRKTQVRRNAGMHLLTKCEKWTKTWKWSSTDVTAAAW